MILSSNTPKRIILILNKIGTSFMFVQVKHLIPFKLMKDLVPKPVVQQWLEYLRNEYPTIAFKASTQKQRDNLGRSSSAVINAADRMLGGSECFGADELMKLLKNYCRNQNIKTAITIGVIGFPNVGKSSVINSLKRSKVCGVGSTPGLTKAAQTITLDKNIKLLDCPGIVFSQTDDSSVEAVLRNCVKVELLEDPVAPVEAIVQRCKKEQLVMMYNIPLFTDHNDFLVHVARQRGRLRKVDSLFF
jgi:nuclear GTP-binding protein